MAKNKKETGLLAQPRAAQNQAKDRHFRNGRDNLEGRLAPLRVPTVAKKPLLVPVSKYPSYFELVTNSDKKKKLEIQDTEDINPQPGFAFVRSGDPILTEKCKEISRERGFLMFRVLDNSNWRKPTLCDLGRQLSRVGYHVRESVLEEALESVGSGVSLKKGAAAGEPEPIPEKQEEINAQADAAIRDLFPRIPNTDRQQIIDRAFNKIRRHWKDPKVPVGLAPTLPLTRRVQLAVLAHIRHDLTPYDSYLRSGTARVRARKLVEPVCLDYLVKWRGDEETGRDQLDEILREVIVIDDEDDDESSDDLPEPSVGATSRSGSPGRWGRVARYEGYHAARNLAWQQAVDRQRGQYDMSAPFLPSLASVTNGYQTVDAPLSRPSPRPSLPEHFSNGYQSLDRNQHSIHARPHGPELAYRSAWTPSPDRIGPDWYWDNQRTQPQEYHHPWQSYPTQASYPPLASYPPQAYYAPQEYRQAQQPPRPPENAPTTQRVVIDLTDDGPIAPPEPMAMIPVQNKFPKRFESPPPAEQYHVRPVHSISGSIIDQEASGSGPGFEQFRPGRVTRQERVLGVLEGPAPQPNPYRHERTLGYADASAHERVERVLGYASHPEHVRGEDPAVYPASFRQERVLGYEYGYLDLPR